jgi:hypothetical protein
VVSQTEQTSTSRSQHVGAKDDAVVHRVEVRAFG